MQENLLRAAASNPYAALRLVLGGPLHPGDGEATDDLLDRAHVEPRERFVDLGCGEGQAVAKARQRGARAFGLDATTDGADVRARIERLPLATDSVDVAFSECTLCLAEDLDTVVSETARILTPGGRLAFSDVTVDRTLDHVPEPIAEPLCLTGQRQRKALLARLREHGFTVETVRDHHDELVAMREKVHDRVDVEGLFEALGDRGTRLKAAVDELESALEDRDVGYVSVVASQP